jgi:hypothetical protein
MRFRFTIRDLLWLTVVVALAVGWWLERTNLRMRLDVSLNAEVKLRARFEILGKELTAKPVNTLSNSGQTSPLPVIGQQSTEN